MEIAANAPISPKLSFFIISSLYENDLFIELCSWINVPEPEVQGRVQRLKD
jgi:hypothetical protein